MDREFKRHLLSTRRTAESAALALIAKTAAAQMSTGANLVHRLEVSGATDEPVTTHVE
jgi:hypothetical protein